MSSTINDLIAAAISGNSLEEAEKTASETVVEPTDEIEKLASALEFMAERGIESFIHQQEATPVVEEPEVAAVEEVQQEEVTKVASEATPELNDDAKRQLIKEALAAKLAEAQGGV